MKYELYQVTADQMLQSCLTEPNDLTRDLVWCVANYLRDAPKSKPKCFTCESTDVQFPPIIIVCIPVDRTVQAMAMTAGLCDVCAGMVDHMAPVIKRLRDNGFGVSSVESPPSTLQ